MAAISSDNFSVHALPPFANEYNKALGEKIKELEIKLNSLNTSFDDNSSRADIMGSHMKNVKQELGHTQALYDAKSRQIDTEDHFKQIADRESGRLNIEINRVEKEIAEMSDNLLTIQNNIYKGNEKIDAIKSELKLEKDELEEWLRVQAEKEEDNLAMLNYSKEDESKIKELNLLIEKLTAEVNKKKALLSVEVTETQISQIELDKATNNFKQLHEERQSLINQWEQSIKTMQKRDQDISQAQSLYKSLNETIKEKFEKIKERQQFLEDQLGKNLELEKKIAIGDRTVSIARMNHSEMTSNLMMQKDELEVAKNTLHKTASTVTERKNEISNLNQEFEIRQNQYDKELDRQSQLESKLKTANSDKITMEAKSQQLQEIFHQEDLHNKSLDRNIKILKEVQFKKNQELFKLKQHEKIALAEIAGGESSLRNLKARLHQIDQDSLKQQAMLYAHEFQIQQLERKVRRAQGDRSDDEKEMLLKKIESLTIHSDTLNKRYSLIQAQYKKAQDDLRQSKRRLEIVRKEKTTVVNSIEELELYNESASNQLNVKIREKEELMVEENIRKLELRKLRGFLNVRADEVYNLENRQVGLQMALEARTKEIEIHKDILKAQVKNAEEEKQSVNFELRERIGKAEKLKKRYEILMTQFAPEDGGEDHSQAYYVIKAAQDREQLQREGDELDANIRRAEKEIKALENTLNLMNNRNEEYRSNIHKAELDSKDIQHKEMLEIQFRQVMERYREKREMIQDFQQQLMQLERSLISLNNEEAEKLHNFQSLQGKLKTLESSIKEQNAKKDRAQKSIVRSSIELHKKIGIEQTEKLPEERDFIVRKAKELGNLVMVEIKKIINDKPDLVEKNQHLCLSNAISMPSRTVSRVTSVASSIRDDISDSSSNSQSKKKHILVQSRGIYRPAKEKDEGSSNSQISSGVSTPTFSKKITTTDLNDAFQPPSVSSKGQGSSSSGKSSSK